nr:hypothetical protein [Methanothrix sp.]
GNAASELWDMIQTSKSTIDELRRIPSDLRGALKSMMKSPDERLFGRHDAALTIDNLAKSGSRTVYLGMGTDEFLIYGHTHIPTEREGGGNKYRVANVGSWNKTPCEEYRYLVIRDGVVKPEVWS